MTIIYLKGREAPKSSRSAMETMLFTRDEVNGWKLPSFQRPIRVNAKVLQVAEEMRGEGGIVPGEAFKISDLPECIADVRIINFANMAEMAEEFAELNGRLVNMRPDDILRALEEGLPMLRRIRDKCEFVTYGQIKRGDARSPVIGMSQLLRCWHMSRTEVPAANAPPATALASALDMNEVDKLVGFMTVARSAWGSDPENYRLWGALNLTIAMWIWRRLVLDQERGVKRSVVMTPESFRRCLMSVSADTNYLDWLVGRNLGERDRSPCYNRLKATFIRRLQQDTTKKVLLPSPSWASK